MYKLKENVKMNCKPCIYYTDSVDKYCKLKNKMFKKSYCKDYIDNEGREIELSEDESLEKNVLGDFEKNVYPEDNNE